MPTGIIFGCMLLDCEEIVHEWKNWRTVSEEFFQNSAIAAPQLPSKAFGGSSSAGPSHQASNTSWRQELLERQESQPPGAIQKAYAHPGWIPLARDWGGNCIAVDLAPGPAGKWGQVIIFGRDYDCKYVVARSWAAFLASVADDFSNPNVTVEEETGELKLKLFKKQNVEPPYLEILRWRVDQRFGRRPPRRKPANGLGLNTNVDKSRGSPYGSPGPSEDRGRSPHRFNNRGPTQSPKTQFGVSSPLARVTEEASSPVTSNDKAPVPKAKDPVKESSGEDLMEMATPIIPNNAPESATKESDKAPEKDSPQEVPLSEKTGHSDSTDAVVLETENLDDMKTVAI